MRRMWLLNAVALVLFIVCGRARAQSVIPVGTEFQVNTYTSAEQDYPRVCKAPNGAFTVVWEHDSDSAEDVRAQRYASSGAPLGTEFQVNSYTSGEQQSPAICCSGSGDFVVVWHSGGRQDGLGDGVFGQRFASSGAFVGTEFQVNTYTSDDQQYAAVCCDQAGAFVVAWESVSGQDGSSDGVFAQRFGSAGGFLGSEFQVNTYTPSSQDYPAICCSADGNFVVAWESYMQDSESNETLAQRFASDGTARGSEFQVNTFTDYDQEEPAICCDAAGNFVIAWESEGQDGDEDGVFAQRFADSGATRGTEFQVNVTTSSNQDDPALCCGLNGDFIVAWSGERQDGNGYGVFTRRYAASGAGSHEFQVNTYTSGDQEYPSIGCDPTGNFVIVWESGSSQDGQDQGIFGRRFTDFFPVSPTPTLSFLGLVAGLIGLLGTGWAALRRRR